MSTGKNVNACSVALMIDLLHHRTTWDVSGPHSGDAAHTAFIENRETVTCALAGACWRKNY